MKTPLPSIIVAATAASLAAVAAFADTARPPDAVAESAAAALNTTAMAVAVSPDGALDTTPQAFTLVVR